MNLSLLPPAMAQLYQTLRSRREATNTTSPTCTQLNPGELIIPRTIFIVALTICIFITSLSVLAITALACREWARHQQVKAAKAWGRKSTYKNRISTLRKEVDLSFSRQYSGCLVNEPENPFLKCNSPVELGPDQRVWEAPNLASTPAPVKDQRRSKALSLFFDQRVGLWMAQK